VYRAHRQAPPPTAFLSANCYSCADSSYEDCRQPAADDLHYTQTLPQTTRPYKVR
jgi:hypothetical protein